MSLIACALVLLVVSGLYTSLMAGAAAIMLTSELSDNTVSMYDQPALDYGFDHAITKTTTIATDIVINESFYQPSFSDLKPMLAKVRPERVSFRPTLGSISGNTLEDVMSASSRAAHVIRRRSTVFHPDSGLLFMRC